MLYALTLRVTMLLLVAGCSHGSYPVSPQIVASIRQDTPTAIELVPPGQGLADQQDAAGQMIREVVPELDVAENVRSLIEGRYYSYAEVAELLRSRPLSKVEASQAQELEFSRLESESGVYVTLQSLGFSKQEVLFFNTNEVAVQIDLSEYFLKPIKSEVQRIGLSMDSSVGRTILSTIEAALKDTIIRNSAYWYGGRLTPEEAAFIRDRPIEALNAYAQSRRAVFSTWKHLGRNSEGEESGAFRHFVWAGLLVQQLGGASAEEFLSAHEQLPLNAKEAERLSSEMDQWNNSEGMKAAKALLDREEFSISRLEREAYEALTDGRLKIIHSKGRHLIYPVSP